MNVNTPKGVKSRAGISIEESFAIFDWLPQEIRLSVATAPSKLHIGSIKKFFEAHGVRLTLLAIEETSANFIAACEAERQAMVEKANAEALLKSIGL